MKSRLFKDVEICVKMIVPIGTHTPFASILEHSLSRIVRTLRCPGRNTEANSSAYMRIPIYTTYFIKNTSVRQRKNERFNTSFLKCSSFIHLLFVKNAFKFNNLPNRDIFPIQLLKQRLFFPPCYTVTFSRQPVQTVFNLFAILYLKPYRLFFAHF